MFHPRSELGAAAVRRARSVATAAAAMAAALAIAFAPANAQQAGTVTGQVTSASGQALAEATIQIVGTNRSALTNNQGRYLITNVPTGVRLVRATIIGYAQGSQEITVSAGETAIASFALEQTAVQLEGMVVTGTAIAAERREIGNSIDLITAEDIETSGVSSIEDVLRGRIQGMTVQGSNAQPGVGSEINIRGLTSINGRVSPLIYVDGVRVGSENMAFDDAGTDGGAATVLGSISLEDVERIEVIKGAAATTLYGTDATAGVVQIFTKRGQPGERAQWTVIAEAGLVTPPHVGPGEDIDPTGLHLNRCDINGPLPRDTIPGPDPDCPASGSWLRNAWSQDYTLQVRGGTNDVSYFASGGFERREGIINTPDEVEGVTEIEPSRADNVFLRANFGFSPLEDLQIQINSAYTNRQIDFIPDGWSDESLIWNVAYLDLGDTPDDRDAQVFLQIENQDINQFTTSAALNWTPTDNMRHRLNVGFDWSDSNRKFERKRGHFNEEDGHRHIDIEQNRVITLDYAGSWLWELAAIDNYSFTTSWGGQLNDRQSTGLRGDSEDFINRGRTVIEDGATFTNINEDRAAFINGGVFLQQQIGWNNQVFLTGGLRVDTYNTIDERLNSRAEWQVFPRLQGTYTMSDHVWWPTDMVETFRLRAAYGVAGDPPPQTASRTLWDIRLTGRSIGDGGQVGYVVDQIGNTGVGPERTSEWEAGADLSALEGRVSLSGQYFRRHTEDGLIFNDPIPSQGIIEPVPFNIGEWETWGYEATLDLNILRRRNFRWDLNTTYQYTNNEMLNIGVDEDGSYNLDSGLGLARFRPGFPFPAIFDNKILNPDAVGELPVYTDTAAFFGVNIPPKEISVNTSFGIGNRLSVDLFGYGQWGHFLLDTQAYTAAGAQLWPGCEDVFMAMEAWRDAGSPEDQVPAFKASEIARCDDEDYVNNQDWYDEGDFFRFSSVAARYRIPENWLPAAMSAATVQFRVQNLNLWTDFNGTDPDAIRGAGTQQQFREAGFVMPLPRTYSLNLRVNF